MNDPNIFPDQGTVQLVWAVANLALRWALGLMATWLRRKSDMATAATDQFLSVGDAGERIGVTAWQVSRLYERGFMTPAPRIGGRRIIPVADLPRLKEAARKAGYLK